MEIKLIEIKQRHFEAFIKEMPNQEDTAKTSLGLYPGIVARAACKAGWFLEPQIKEEDVDDMSPQDVMSLYSVVMKKYSEIMEVPPS